MSGRSHRLSSGNSSSGRGSVRAVDSPSMDQHSRPASRPWRAKTKTPRRKPSGVVHWKSDRTRSPTWSEARTPPTEKSTLAQPQPQRETTRAFSSCGRNSLAFGVPCSRSHFTRARSRVVRGLSSGTSVDVGCDIVWPNDLAFSGTSGRAKRVTRSVRCNAWLGPAPGSLSRRGLYGQTDRAPFRGRFSGLSPSEWTLRRVGPGAKRQPSLCGSLSGEELYGRLDAVG
jgi:hypothetical protein